MGVVSAVGFAILLIIVYVLRVFEKVLKRKLAEHEKTLEAKK